MGDIQRTELGGEGRRRGGKDQSRGRRYGAVYIEYYMLKSTLLPETEEGDPEQEFELLDLLGQGAYGQVNKALHKKTGELYAIKILSASNLSQINSIKKEIQILRLCDNEHIVKYFGSYFKDNNLWIVLEYCHAGSIIDLLNITQKQLNQYQIASILESTLHGLTYLHEHKKIHRDIKAANILLTIEGVAKLADFGVSTESMYTNAGHKSQVGSPYWMSPEVMKHSQYTNKTDIWSLGVTAIELAEGVVPNSHLKPLIAMWQLKDRPVQGFKEPDSWSPEFNSFVKDCLNTNPANRPEAKSLLSHPFIQKYSKGQQLLSQLVQKSLTEIEQFRLGQKEEEDSDIDFTVLLNQSGTGTGTIVNKTERSREQVQQPQAFESSMIINEANGSMIVNDHESSMVVVQIKEKPASFLNQYISNLKNTDNEVENEKEAMRNKIKNYDEICLKELEELYDRHKQDMEKLLVGGLDQQFFGLDQKFVQEELKSRLHTTANVKQFICQSSKYQEVKQFQRTELAKKKSNVSKIATQANDPSSGDLFQFKEKQSHNVKSQEFTEKEFRNTEKHCFYSKSIISDMANVKDAKDFHQEERKLRVIATEPVEWGGDVKPFMPPQEKNRLKQLFFDDPDVKDSILSHIQAAKRVETYKYDRDKVVAESTLYHDWAEDSQGLKHQYSVILARGTSLTKNHYSEQEYLMPHQQFEEEDTETNINLFNPKGSVKLTKNWENKSAKRPKGKRSGVSMQKKGRGNYASGTGQKKHAK